MVVNESGTDIGDLKLSVRQGNSVRLRIEPDQTMF